MSNQNDLNMGGLLQIDHYGQSDPLEEPVHPRPKNRHGSMSEKSNSKSRTRKEAAPSAPTLDAWMFLEVLLQKWKLIFFGGCLVATLGFLGSFFLLHRTYMAVATLMRFQPTITAQFFNPPVLTPDTFAALLKSPELLQIVSTNSHPPASVDVLNKAVFIKTEPDSDVVKVGVKAFNPQVAVNLANLYASNAVHFTRELQRREAQTAVANYFKEQLAFMDTNISSLEDQARRSVPGSAALISKLNQMGNSVSNLNQQAQMPLTVASSVSMSRSLAKLQQARDEVDKLLLTLTPANPRVQAAQQLVNTYEKEVTSAATNSSMGAIGSGLVTTATTAGGPMINPEYDIIIRKLQAIDGSRQQLEDRKREAEAFQRNPPGNVNFLTPATLKNMTPDKHWLKVSLATIFGGILGMGLAIAGVLLVEFADDRLKTAADVSRVTKLPIIATLDDLNNKGPSAREKWAFRTWTMLQGRLSPSSHQGLVCGITSSTAGEGRSTWINMLAEAASMSGFRVLTIATRNTVPDSEESEDGGQEKVKKGKPDQNSPQKPVNGSTNHATSSQPNGVVNGDENSTALSISALTSPGEVTQQLTGPDPQPLVHIPLPGWVWNLERRKQWHDALAHWQQIDNLVILVELPPASKPEAVLLGENLPNVVWLAESGKADAAETRSQLETLRHARCNLVGAVLNREPATPLKSRFPRWLGCLVLFTALSLMSARAEQTNQLTSVPPPAIQNTNDNDLELASTNSVSFSVMNPANRGDWQKRLTLGPGDILSFVIYGQPETARAEVFVGPDGRIGYLEAQNIMAAGLTIDELRTNIDNELSKYRRAPRTIITPMAFMSKRYYMLGKVVQRGVYTLDRPITVLEAVARAHGLETGLSDRNTLDLADFERSFLMRKGKRYPLNFEKLFGEGDLSQNIPIEPDDYIFFPSAILKEVYVLGEVRLPGVVPYTTDLTVIGALSARGGFADKAYKSRVMVIRGSLNNPKAFVVDTRAILDARGQDFQLQSKDIIYVTDRPFSRVEDLLELGVTAFLQSLTAQWAGRNIGPFIGSPILPNF
jgi:protein involved in polysaccharide export with SLBB domain/capsular polysaccharide biosynthesis protein